MRRILLRRTSCWQLFTIASNAKRMEIENKLSSTSSMLSAKPNSPAYRRNQSEFPSPENNQQTFRSKILVWPCADDFAGVYRAGPSTQAARDFSCDFCNL